MKLLWSLTMVAWLGSIALVAISLPDVRADGRRPAVEEAPGTRLYAPTRQEWAVLYMKATKTIIDTSRFGVSRVWDFGNDTESVRCTLHYGKDTSMEVVDGLRRSAEIAFNEFKRDMQWPWLKLEIVTQAGTPVLQLRYP